jgi:hypothetical protein
MARKVIEMVLDDIDGSEGAETVAFSYAGTSYEVDLSSENREALEQALAPYISAARTTGGGRRARSKPSGSRDLQAIREWARANGHTVSDRGRVAGDIVAAYEAAGK